MVEPPSGGTDGAPEFADDAAKAGLVLPTPHPVRPWLAVGICAVVIVASVGAGYAFGWFNPRAVPPPHYSHPGSCASPVAVLNGSLDADATGATNRTFAALATNYTSSNGGCIAFQLHPAPSAGALSALAAGSSTFDLRSAPLGAADLAGLPYPVYQAPVTLGAVAVLYDLPGISGRLRLNGTLLAEIYQGEITRWNASGIEALNPGLDLAAAPALLPLHLDGPDGGTAPFSTYLAASDPAWADQVGAGDTVAWPAGTAVSGPGAMAARLASTPGALGYAELGSFSSNASVAVAQVENLAGTFVGPTVAAVSAEGVALANSSAAFNQSWGSVSLPELPSGGGYPLTEVGFLVVFQDLGRAYNGSLSPYDAWWQLSFFEWAVNGNAQPAAPGDVGPIPTTLASFDGQVLAEVSYHGTSVLVGGSDSGETGGETGEF